jgi:hypothetical protein
VIEGNHSTRVQSPKVKLAWTIVKLFKLKLGPITPMSMVLNGNDANGADLDRSFPKFCTHNVAAGPCVIETGITKI